MTKFKTYFRTFYFSIAAITILVLTVFVFMSLFGDYLIITKSGVRKIYFADNISPSHKIVIDRFNKLYKGKIEVVPIDLPFEKFSTNERKELLIRYLRSKSDRVDLFSVDQIWVPRFAKWTEPLSNYFPVPLRNQIIPQALESCFYKDQLVAVPLYFDIGLMYYRSDLLKKLPDYTAVKNELDNFITWEKFIRLGEKLKSTGNPFYLFPADNYEGLMCSFVELLESQNEKLFVNDSVRLNTRAAEKSLQLLVDLVHKYKLSPTVVSSFKETESYNYFLKNDGIFLRGWPGFLKWYMLNKNSEDAAKQFEIAPLPHFDGGKPAG
ncbi:MAG: extracellular solute-binding protein, partial [Bacteroidota bacterium]